MDIEILKKHQEPLMNRTYFEAKLVFDGKTPSRIDILKNLCTKLSSKEGVTVVYKIDTDYGSERAVVTGYVYDDEETLKKIENKHIVLRHMTQEVQKAERDKIKAARQAAAAAKKVKK